ASIPRDVVMGAQQQWLPNLAKEIAGGPINTDSQALANDREQNISASSDTQEPSASVASPPPAASDRKEVPTKEISKNKYDPPACMMRVFGQCLVPAAQGDKAEEPPQGENVSKEKHPASSFAEPMRAGLTDVGPTANSQAGNEKPANKSDE